MAEEGELEGSIDNDPLAAGDDFLSFSTAKEPTPVAKTVIRDVSAASVASSAEVVDNRLMLRPLNEVPWGRVRGRSDPPLVTLHNEILDFCDLLAPTKQELQERQRVRERVEDVVRDMWSDFDIKPFGSELTKVFLPESDIDMVVLPPQQLHVGKVRNCLFQMADRFKQDEELAAVEVIASARVPIIKLRFQTVQVDVSFSSDSGLRSGRYMLEMMDEMPPLRPLILVLKYFLAQRGMNETFTGGMGSFCLQLMLISYLQHYKKEADLWGRERPINLGSLLLGFLRLYGLEYKYDEVGISVLGEGLYYSKLQRGFYLADRPFLLAVENPLDTSADVGRNSYRIEVIKAAFAQAYMRAYQALRDPRPSGTPTSILGLIIRSDEVLTGRPLPKRPVFHTSLFRTQASRVSYDEDPPRYDRYEERGGRHSGGGGGGGQQYDRFSGGGGGGGGGRYRDEERVGEKRGRWSGGRVENEYDRGRGGYYEEHDRRGGGGGYDYKRQRR